MKKKIGWLLALVVMVVGVFSLVACGGVEGTYKFYSLEEDGETYFIGDMYEDFEITEDFYLLELKRNGTFVAKNRGEVASEGIWRLHEDGTKIDFMYEGEVQTLEVSGNQLIMDLGDDKLILQK